MDELDDNSIRHICLISGGKDSTALAIHLRDTRPELEVEYVFCDTQKELPETYEYLVRIEAYLGKPVVRLCSEHGDRGFDHWLQVYRGFLPSPSARWCTKELKIHPFERYVGDDLTFLYIGIRADENRVGYIPTKPNIIPSFPLREDGLNKADVLRTLSNSGIGLPGYMSWRSRSGCYFCFYQRKVEWVNLMERYPDLFLKAKAYEKPEEHFTWCQGESLADLEVPERIKAIREQECRRQESLCKNRKPRTLAEVLAPGFADPEEEPGCLICHK
jgi:hypothetical protein